MTDKNQIEKKVMAEIKSGRVQLRSKYIFLAEKLGLRSALVLTVLLAVLFFNLVLFYLKASDNLAYLSFGNSGVFAFLESFPYLLVVSLIVLGLLAGFIIKKIDFNYKKPFGYLAVGLVGFIIVGGIILAYTNVAENIEKDTFESRPGGFLFKPFLAHGLEARNRGIVGRIVEFGDGYITIQTPQALEKIILTDNSVLPPQPISPGMFVMAIGVRNGKDFTVSKLQIINPEEMPMIQRGVHRRFGQFQPRHELPERK
ncbi:MAG: hypothetical protein WCT11_02910 [Candidatus Magasanikbacteria bacterium]